MLYSTGSPGSAATLAELETGYAGLDRRKALAAVPGDSGTHGVAHSQSQDVLATLRALTDCEAQRQPDAPPCELIRLNEIHIRTGAQLRAEVPRAPHPLYLWRYRSDDAVVFLAGSIHTLKPSLYPLPVQVTRAFDEADTLVLEVNIEDIDPQALQRKISSIATLPAGTTLVDVLPGPLYQRLQTQMSRYGVPLERMQHFNPSMVMTQFVVTRLMSFGYDATIGVEEHLLARAHDKRILQLETPEAQLELLFGQPLETQIDMLSETLDQDVEFEPMLSNMITAWLSGDDAAFEDLFRRQAGDSALARDFNRQLLDDRNVVMAEKISGYLQDEGVYFVLIGAAHFIGDSGIVAELERRQITGERIYSDMGIAPETVH